MSLDSRDPRDAAFRAIGTVFAANARAMLLTNDMGALGVDELCARYPDRVVNAGIAEQNLISVAAGLALSGRTVFTWGILSHMTARCYEQLRLDVCTRALPVIGIASGAGLSYGVDGPTHHGIHDLGPLRALPGMAIWNPCDARIAEAAVLAAYRDGGPAIVRLDKEAPEPAHDLAHTHIDMGLASLRAGSDATIVATGASVHRALEAASQLAREGISARVVDLFRLAPIDEGLLTGVLAETPVVVSVEEHARTGGLASLLAERIAELARPPRFRALALADRLLLGVTTRERAEQDYGIGATGIAHAVLDLLTLVRRGGLRPARRAAIDTSRRVA